MIMATQTQPEQDSVGYPDFTLPVSIIAQIIETLKVDIAAQTLAELKVDIAAQTLATVDIDISAQSISVKLVPDWGAIEAEDVDVCGIATAASGEYTTVVSYTVPTAKTLLVYDWSAALQTGEGQIVGILYNLTKYFPVGYGGGSRGFQTPLTKPKRFTSDQTIQIIVRQDTGVTLGVYGHFGGTLL